MARLWPASGTEPSTWLVSRTDSTAALQVAGSVGLRAYSSSTTTNNPITVAFDSLVASPLSVSPPPAPVASFTWKQASGTNTVNFSDTSTNSPTSWSWTFGDGSTSTSQNPSHTYAASGTYTATLTATNASGPSVPAASQSVVVTAAPSAYASDTFARTAASGTWGSAQVGGAYTYVGSQSDFSLTGSAGQINLPTAGANRAAFLAVSAQDVDLTYQFGISALPAGGGSVYTYGTVRHSATADYRAKVRVTGTGAVYLSFSQYSGGAESTLGSEVLVAGLTYVAGTEPERPRPGLRDEPDHPERPSLGVRNDRTGHVAGQPDRLDGRAAGRPAESACAPTRRGSRRTRRSASPSTTSSPPRSRRPAFRR